MDAKKEILSTIGHVLLRRREMLYQFRELHAPQQIITRQEELVKRAEKRWDAAATLACGDVSE